MIVKATTYGRPSDPFVRIVEECKVLPDGTMQVEITAYNKGEIRHLQIVPPPWHIEAKA